jgi:DNA topoisomerase III
LFYQTERNMVAVCQGTKSKNDMIVEAVEQYKDMFLKARTNFDKVVTVMINVNCMER